MKYSELAEIIRRIVRAKKKTMDEARIIPTSTMGKILPEEYADLIEDNIIDDSFGEGVSGFDLYDTIGQTFTLEDYDGPDDEYEGEKIYLSIEKLFKKYPNGGTFVSNNVENNFPKAPGAPPNTFSTRVYLDPRYKSLRVSVPHISENEKNVGWFDMMGKYHPDIKNFDEDGNYIGNNVDEARIIPIPLIKQWKSEENLPQNVEIDWSLDWDDIYQREKTVYGTTLGFDQYGRKYVAKVEAPISGVYDSDYEIDSNYIHYHDIKLVNV